MVNDGYDALNRLIRAQYSDYGVDYTYDNAGRRQTEIASGTKSYNRAYTCGSNSLFSKQRIAVSLLIYNVSDSSQLVFISGDVSFAGGQRLKCAQRINHPFTRHRSGG